MLFKLLRGGGFNKYKVTHFSAHKYMKSVTETALLYRPQQMLNLTTEENIKDRVVQTFFDSSNFHIKVSEAEHRLTDINSGSTPAHSFYQINLPFENNHTLRKKMTQFSSNNIRAGRLLELMDYIAANVAYRYCTPDSEKDLDMNELDFIVVTAAIDQIEFYYPISSQIDCLLSGYVSSVGTSSMQVHIDVLQKIGNKERLSCSANFVMVARSKETGKAKPVPKLNLEQEVESFRIINEMGRERQKARKNEAKRGLEIAPPTYEESVVIHNLRKIMKIDNSEQKHYKSISSTFTRNTILMHHQDKNLSGKIFGGHILRYGYEVAWLCAAKFLNTTLPIINQIDEVLFLAPVEIGSYIDLSATIGYVDEKYMHVTVKCENSSLSGVKRLTNILHVTFQHEQPDLNKVYPETLTESYIYIEAMRRINKLNQIQH